MNLDELTKLEQAMTPGTWAVKPGDVYWRVDGSTGEVFDDGSAGGEYATTCSEDDRDGIVALRNAAPALIAAAKERDELAALLRQLTDAAKAVDATTPGGVAWALKIDPTLFARIDAALLHRITEKLPLPPPRLVKGRK